MAPLVADARTVLHLAGIAGRPAFVRRPRTVCPRQCRGHRGRTGPRARARHRAVPLRLELVGLRQRDPPCPPARTPRPWSRRSPYAASKRAAELVAASVCRNAPAMRCAALRFFTVYGPRQRPEMAITRFMRAAIAESRSRSSARLDAARLHARRTTSSAACSPRSTSSEAPGFREYNLGSGAPIDLRTLVEAVAATAGVRVRVETAPVPLGDVDATFADVTAPAKSSPGPPRCRYAEGPRDGTRLGSAPIPRGPVSRERRQEDGKGSRFKSRRLTQSRTRTWTRKVNLLRLPVSRLLWISLEGPGASIQAPMPGWMRSRFTPLAGRR